MKRFILILTSLLLMSQLYSQSQVMSASSPKSLVVYYSYSGVTETLAQAVADNCDGTLLEVVDHGNYPRPESQTTYNYANNERSQIDAGNWPEIHTSVNNFDDWDAVFICTPLWNGKMANPMLTFLHNHAEKLVGKQVALAVTSWSSGITNVVADAHNTLPESIFLGNPLHINYGARPQIAAKASEWVSTILPEIEIPQSNKIRVIVGGKTFRATLASNATGRAFADMLPMTINMAELNGNEKYYYMSSTLPTDASCPGTIHTGDIMLYGSSCVVLFYATFQTSYSYTPIGTINDPTGLAEAVGSGAATVTFEMAPFVLGDVNDDGELSIGDVTYLISLVLADNVGYNESADINNDREVNIADISSLIHLIITAK